jgi:hypothetical protein
MAVSLLLPPSPATASELLEQERITICTSLRTGYQLISKTGKCNERIYEARTWYQKGAAPSGTPGSIMLELRSCISKKSAIQVIRMRADCNPRIHRTALWQRPLGPPLAPSINSVVMGVLGSATLNITAPIEDGGSKVTSYLLTSTPGQIEAIYTPAQIKEAKVIGLSPGSTYSFSVVAINEQGPSVSSIASSPALAPTTPGAPSITKVTATGTNSAQLSFTAPLDDGGSPITSYVATSSPGGLKTTLHQSTGGTINITNLSHSTTYTFTLTANNAAGPSLSSAISTSITTETPPPPPEPVAVAPSAPTNTVISVAAIAGVTAPVTGATPVSTTTAGTGYTGSVSWSGSPATFAGATIYTATITLTATSGYTLTGVNENFFTVAGATTVTNSANSGVVTAVFPATAYIVGDTGPGGGKIIYYSESGFNCGPEFSSTGSPTGGKCNYLEVAPTGWNNPADSDTQTVWAIGDYAKQGILEINDDLIAYNNVLGVGLGYKNSELIVAQNGTYDSDINKYAAGEARAYRGNSKDDWYLPSTAELNLMCQWARAVSPDVTTRCTGGTSAIGRGFQQNIYWSSSEELYLSKAGYWRVWAQTFNGGVQTPDFLKSSPLYVRPVRAF